MKYQLFVYCSKLGISRDDGLHAECEADSDAAAITELTKQAKSLLHSFDLIVCTIIEPNGSYGEGRKVHKFTLRLDSELGYSLGTSTDLMNKASGLNIVYKNKPLPTLLDYPRYISFQRKNNVAFGKDENERIEY